MTHLALLCHVPARSRSVAADIRSKGWSITQGLVLPGHLAQIDAWRKEVVIPKNFRERLVCPSLEKEVANWVLAHELAHIHLHLESILQGHRTEAMERAAADWALHYLVPASQLRDHPDIRGMASATKSQRWARMARAAEYFQVPTAAVESAMIRYGMAQGHVYLVSDFVYLAA